MNNVVKIEDYRAPEQTTKSSQNLLGSRKEGAGYFLTGLLVAGAFAYLTGEAGEWFSFEGGGFIAGTLLAIYGGHQTFFPEK